MDRRGVRYGRGYGMGTRIILNLVILNLIQVILTVFTIILLTSCAPDHRPPLWLRAIETLPQVEGFSRAGLFTINEKIYVQYCDPGGNQVWMSKNLKATHYRNGNPIPLDPAPDLWDKKLQVAVVLMITMKAMLIHTDTCTTGMQLQTVEESVPKVSMYPRMQNG